MFRKAIILFVVLLFPFLSHGQASREKKALKYLHSDRYNSAYILLKKALAKDTANVAARYVLAEYYAIPQNEDYSLDSAYIMLRLATEAWTAASLRERAKLQRFPLDSAILSTMKERIEEEAFITAKNANSEEAYNKFLTFYQGTIHQGAAILLRDKVAFEAAVKVNSPNAFSAYMKKYPSSDYVAAAKEKYDYLIFQEGTKDGNLEAYASYLEANTGSPYRRKVEQQIFEISTADGSPDSFANYIRAYPDSYFAGQAKEYLSHLINEEQRREVYHSIFLQDSLATHRDADGDFLVAFLQNGKFGLMNACGDIVVEPSYEEIAEEYICGNIEEDLIVLPGKVITKHGSTLLAADVDTMDDLGAGFILAGTTEGKILFHKNGTIFPEQKIEDARVIGGRLVAIQQDGRWGLFTIAGRRILASEFTDVEAIGNVVVLKVDKKFTMSMVSSLAAMTNNEKGRFTDSFDEVKRIAGDKLWVRVDEYEGVLDQKLELVVRMDTHKLTPAHFGIVATSAAGISTFNEFGEESPVFRDLQIVNPWVAAKNDSGWMLFDPKLRIPKSVSYDSISIYGPFGVGIRKDGLEIHIHNNPRGTLNVPPQERIIYLPGNDSTAWLALLKNKNWSIYSNDGRKLFSTSYEPVQSAGENMIVVTSREKKGLLNSSGKQVLPLEYNAIGNAQNGNISLLKSMKFGLFNRGKKMLIPAEYEKNIVPYNGNIFSVFKNGLWGFVDGKNKPLGKIEYDEIVHWTDTVALVRSKDKWMFYNVFNQQPEIEDIKSFKVIKDTPTEKLFIVDRKGYVGVVSNVRGIIIPVNFSDVVNVGSDEYPIYFTEKHVPEASLFVVIYYDKDGKFLRKEVYEQDDYERIYCNRK